MSNPDIETDREEAKSTDFGSALAAARKSNNYTIEDVCAQLKIPPRIIEAIENSNVSVLPEATFTQGYIRSYARFLEISEDNVLAIYKQTLPQEASQKLKSCSHLPNETNSKSPLMKIVTWLLVLAAFSAIIYGGFQYYQNKADAIETEREFKKPGFTGRSLDSAGDIQPDNKSKDIRQADAQPIKIQPITIQQHASLTEDGELIVQQPVATEKLEITQIPMEESSAGTVIEAVDEAVDETVALVSDEVSPEKPKPEAEEEKQVAPNLDVLTIYAEQGSWMQVHDASTTRLLYNMIPKGSEKTITGQAPFRISLGNAKTTELLINDVAIDMSEYIRENNTARFTVSIKQQRVIFH